MKSTGFYSLKKQRLISALRYGFIVGMLAFANLVAAQESVVVDRIVAVVNNDIITLYDLNRAFRPFAENIKALRYSAEKERQTLFQVRKDILDQLISSKLADQEIKRYRIAVNQKEIDTTIERMKEARYLTDEQLRQGLAEQGLTMEEYRQEVKEQILRTKLVNLEVKSKVVITEDDIKAYYDNHREKYGGEKKYHLWNMFVKLSSSAGPSERKAARKQMEAVVAKLKQGQSFETLVNDLMDSSSAVQGTDLGVFRLEELSRQLRETIKNMNTGEFSGVLDTEFGYQIIYIQEILETPAKPLEEVESDIQQILYDEFVDNKYQEWLEELRRRSHIRIIN